MAAVGYTMPRGRFDEVSWEGPGGENQSRRWTHFSKPFNFDAGYPIEFANGGDGGWQPGLDDSQIAKHETYEAHEEFRSKARNVADRGGVVRPTPLQAPKQEGSGVAAATPAGGDADLGWGPGVVAPGAHSFFQSPRTGHGGAPSKAPPSKTPSALKEPPSLTDQIRKTIKDSTPQGHVYDPMQPFCPRPATARVPENLVNPPENPVPASHAAVTRVPSSNYGWPQDDQGSQSFANLYGPSPLGNQYRRQNKTPSFPRPSHGTPTSGAFPSSGTLKSKSSDGSFKAAPADWALWNGALAASGGGGSGRPDTRPGTDSTGSDWPGAYGTGNGFTPRAASPAHGARKSSRKASPQPVPQSQGQGRNSSPMMWKGGWNKHGVALDPDTPREHQFLPDGTDMQEVTKEQLREMHRNALPYTDSPAPGARHAHQQASPQARNQQGRAPSGLLNRTKSLIIRGQSPEHHGQQNPPTPPPKLPIEHPQTRHAPSHNSLRPATATPSTGTNSPASTTLAGKVAEARQVTLQSGGPITRHGSLAKDGPKKQRSNERPLSRAAPRPASANGSTSDTNPQTQMMANYAPGGWAAYDNFEASFYETDPDPKRPGSSHSRKTPPPPSKTPSPPRPQSRNQPTPSPGAWPGTHIAAPVANQQPQKTPIKRKPVAPKTQGAATATPPPGGRQIDEYGSIRAPSLSHGTPPPATISPLEEAPPKKPASHTQGARESSPHGGIRTAGFGHGTSSTATAAPAPAISRKPVPLGGDQNRVSSHSGLRGPFAPTGSTSEYPYTTTVAPDMRTKWKPPAGTPRQASGRINGVLPRQGSLRGEIVGGQNGDNQQRPQAVGPSTMYDTGTTIPATKGKQQVRPNFLGFGSGKSKPPPRAGKGKQGRKVMSLLKGIRNVATGRKFRGRS